MVRTGMARTLTLRKDELQVQIAGSEPDSAEHAKLVAELLEVQTNLSAGGTAYCLLLTTTTYCSYPTSPNANADANPNPKP